MYPARQEIRMSNVPQERIIQALLCSRLLHVHLHDADVHRVQFTSIHFVLFIEKRLSQLASEQSRRETGVAATDAMARHRGLINRHEGMLALSLQ
jgi:hypothetical protein